MAVGKCEYCSTEEYMPFVCKFCKGRYCSSHRLPENHKCQGLEGYRERLRQEGRLMVGEEAVLTPKVQRTAALSARLENAFAKAEGKMTYVFLGIMAVTYVLQVLLLNAIPGRTWTNIFVLTGEFWRYPWTLLTSMFAHNPGNPFHFIFNALVLFFFGTAVEKLIGTKRFTMLFLGAGVLAGLAQVFLFDYLFGHLIPGGHSGALGASGAIMGVMGALVILAPTMTVLLMFVIPVPLWLIVALYAMFDILGVLNPASGIGHIAHLAGLALGILYAMHLRKQGLRAQVQRPQGSMRRYF